MDTKILQSRIRAKLQPHTDKIENGNFTEYDILPGLFDLFLNNQNDIQNTFKTNTENSEIYFEKSLVKQDQLLELIASNQKLSIESLNSNRKLMMILLILSILGLLTSMTAIGIILFR